MTVPVLLDSRARVVVPSAQPMYAAALRWRDEALIGDRSLFSGQPIDGLSAAGELVRDFVDRPDLSQRDFLSKLREQLAGTSAAGVQLAGELLYVHTLIVETKAMTAKTKLELVNKVLSIAETGTTPVSPDLVQALGGGVAVPGQGYAINRWKMLAYLIRVFEAVKARTGAEREAVVTDWRAFQNLLAGIDDQSVWTQRFALEHLLFPELAPPVLSRDDRVKIVDAFSQDRSGQALDIGQIVAGLEPNVVYGERRGVDLYWAPYRERWQGLDERLERYASWARKIAGAVDLASEERTPKLDRVEKIRRVFEVAQAGEDPAEALRAALSGYNVVDFRVADTFVKWMQGNPSIAAEALRALALKPGAESIDRFLAFVPREAAAGMGARLSIASALLMGLDPTNLPPWRSEAAETTRRLTGGYPVQDSATAGEHYLNFLERLDAIMSAVNADGVLVQDRLDAQGLAWTIAKEAAKALSGWTEAERAAFEAWRSGKPAQSPPPGPGPVSPEPEREPSSLEELAEKLHMPSSEWLEETFALLEEKKQLILQGPPGTGKTYLARELARYLAGDPGRVVTVQFHPGTSYEDFVQGLRPDPADPSRFKVVDGPLARTARAAAVDPGHNYVLVIDEINRGNVPAVFGELYYLLEYRDEQVTMLYGEKLALPNNIFVIGTMNTADRSITALDAALRRRFYVRDLDPLSDPLQGILRRFLEEHAPDLMWLADLLDLANEQLGDPDFAIGPSHFMGDVTETRARRAWNNSVLPTLKEYFHSNLSRVESFDFDTLRAQIEDADVADPEAH